VAVETMIGAPLNFDVCAAAAEAPVAAELLLLLLLPQADSATQRPAVAAAMPILGLYHQGL
jgi:hypothetical protein